MSKARYNYPEFRLYWDKLNPAAKLAFAAATDTSVGYLKQIAGGFSRPSLEMANKIEKASRRKVTRRQFRPEAYA